MDATITSATYAAGSGGTGTLTVKNGTTTVGTLSLAGDFTGYTFQVTPNTTYTSYYNISLIAASSGTQDPPSVGTPGPDAYTWLSTGTDAWNKASNWRDATSNANPAAIAPGTNNPVTINGLSGSSYQPISGRGNSASLTVTNNVTLNGTFNTGGLSVGTTSAAGALNLSTGTVVNAATATLLYGPLQVNGTGTQLNVSGTLTLGGMLSSPYTSSSDNLTVNGGGTVQVGGLSMLVNNYSGYYSRITIDATSKLEIGTTGGAAAGKLTIDAGKTLSGSGSINASAGVSNAGIIIAQGSGGLYFDNGVTGTGQMQIATGSAITLGNGFSTVPISFLGNTGTLGVRSAYNTITNSYNLNEQGLISGFVVGDTIQVDATITSATYAAGSGGTGTLTVKNGTTTVGTLSLAGDFTGYTFQVTPNTTYTSYYNISLINTGAVGTAPPGTTSPDVYTWLGTAGGLWSSATNWKDTTTNTVPAAVAPGANNAVTIVGPTSGTQTITGPGNAASLTLQNNNTLNGVFTTGAFSTTGTLTAGYGTVITATSATFNHGSLAANGSGTRFNVSGAVTLGNTTETSGIFTDALTLSGGAGMQAGSLLLSSAGAANNSITIDSSSSFEVGTVGNAGLGRLTIDAGKTLSGSGSIAAAAGTLNNGTIVAQGYNLSLGAVSGTGTLQIGAGSRLALGGLSSEAVTFTDATGTLGLAVLAGNSGGNLTYTLTETGTVSGFVRGDKIVVSSAVTISSVAYRSTGSGAGVLTVTGGGATLGTLNLAGDYSGMSFAVSPDSISGSYDITVSSSAANPLFDSSYYLSHNADVAAAGIDPYQHYTTYGWKEGRNPAASFDVRDYLAANQDVKAAGIDPLLHYYQSGRAEGRAAFAVSNVAADPLVDAVYYYAHNPDVKAAGVDATAHYLASGWKEGRNPDAFFDTNYYLTQNPDVRAAGVDPLLHFEMSGWKEGRQPSLVFDDAKYLQANPDVAAAGLDPLQHYLSSGMAEGRAAYLTGGTAAADPLVNAVYYDAQLGATIIPTGTPGAQQAAWSYDAIGWQKGLNPDAFFDTNYYLSHNPDVAAAHIDPLLHYENNGWHEGRDPSAQFSTNKYLAAYSDVRNAGIDPLLHYVVNGQAEGRTAFSA